MIGFMYSFVSVVYIFAVTCACAYVSFPFILKFLPSIVVQGTFLNLVCSPRRLSCLHKPKEAWKLEGVNNHYISSSYDGVKLGVWHLLPTDDAVNNANAEREISLEMAKKIIVYCHGNAWHRCFGHRQCLYTLLRNLGFHVIAFDYRGYGDSDGWPSEDGVIEDTVTVYKWVVNQAVHPDCEILIWGHSLGTAIATQALLKMQLERSARLPLGLVLEAPFTTIVDAMTEYPLSKYFVKLYPGNWMENIMLNALSSRSISFSTVNALPLLNIDTLILHAEDDRKINFRLGKKLYEETKRIGEKYSKNVTFVAFDASCGLGHNGIWQHPKLPLLIQQLLSNSLQNGFSELQL